MNSGNERKPRVAIVQWGSYRSYPVGGISTFVESILPHLGRSFELKLVGMSMGEEPGRWTSIDVAGQRYEFLPVVDACQSRVIPDRLRLAWAIAKYRRALSTKDINLYYVHMTEAAIPIFMFTDSPVIIHVHGLYNLFRFSRHRLGRPFAGIYDSAYPQLFARCARVLGAGTDEEFESFRRKMRVREGSAVPTCVRERVFFPQEKVLSRRKLGLNDSDVVLLYVGRFTETKNPLLLLEAEKLLRNDVKNVKLVFLGDGVLRPELERAAAAANNIVVTGPVCAENIALWMNAANVLTIVSKTEAFTSIAALEALSCGLPVVATPVSALPALLRPDVNGTVSDDFSARAYAAAVSAVLSKPPSRRSCIESVARYRSANISRRIIEEIEAVLRPAMHTNVSQK